MTGKKMNEILYTLINYVVLFSRERSIRREQGTHVKSRFLSIIY